MTNRRPLAVRFWEKVDKSGPLPSAEAVAVHPEIKGTRCWIYGTNPDRKRRIRFDHQTMAFAHRVAWYLATGRWPKPPKPCCLHKCDRPACVRIEHLFEGTPQDNVDDMLAKRRDRVFGERNSAAKLTRERVARIRRDCAPWLRHPHQHGTAKLLRDVAKREGVSEHNVRVILRGKIWKIEHSEVTPKSEAK